MGLFGGFKAKFTKTAKKEKSDGIVILKYQVHSEFDSDYAHPPSSNGIKKPAVVVRHRSNPRRPTVISANYNDTNITTAIDKQKSSSLHNLHADFELVRIPRQPNPNINIEERIHNNSLPLNSFQPLSETSYIANLVPEATETGSIPKSTGGNAKQTWKVEESVKLNDSSIYGPESYYEPSGNRIALAQSHTNQDDYHMSRPLTSTSFKPLPEPINIAELVPEATKTKSIPKSTGEDAKQIRKVDESVKLYDSSIYSPESYYQPSGYSTSLTQSHTNQDDYQKSRPLTSTSFKPLPEPSKIAELVPETTKTEIIPKSTRENAEEEWIGVGLTNSSIYRPKTNYQPSDNSRSLPPSHTSQDVPTTNQEYEPSTLISMTQHSPDLQEYNVSSMNTIAAATQTTEIDEDRDEEGEEFKVHIVQHNSAADNHTSEDETSYQEDELSEYVSLGYSSQAASIFFGNDVLPTFTTSRRVRIMYSDSEDEEQDGEADC
ncbi:unnamed protein product [Phaedon cochleariae]|uniref:Uncharacterized protein n=1 Tax=Phaedon cochleariae TaxID=80249 RepID=A0A9P0GS85_PHACE|nr:unnamed protein product [Phaedon cochleariae]